MIGARDWRQERQLLLRRIAELEAQGKCYSCVDLQTGEVFGHQHVIWEDDLFKVVLEQYPRAKGHTIVVFKPHRDDISVLTEDEACRVFQVCVRVTKALKDVFRAEKVYLYTMCDGTVNHLHIQLLPRFAGDPVGSQRFLAERQLLANGSEIANRIRAALGDGAGR